MKRCTRCKEEQPLSEFSPSKLGRQGKHSMKPIKCVSDLLDALKDFPPEAPVVDSWNSEIVKVEMDEDGDVILCDEGRWRPE